LTSRGAFLSALAFGTALPALASLPRTPQRPPALRRGDRVGLIAPASPPTDDDVALSIEHVESYDLVPVLGAFVRAQDGFLAGTDEQRAQDFNRMARDPDIRAIVAIRGGYGTMRILDVLEYDALRRDPKIVMGYSDLTALLNAVTIRSGVITYHGPVGAHGSSWNGPSREYIERALFDVKPIGTLSMPQARRIVAGRARGRLAGGNLSLVSALCGTPFAIAPSDALVFLEEVEEAPYRVDRMLVQLGLAGVLQAASGLLFGQCVRCSGEAPTQPAEAVIDEHLRQAARPAVAGAPIGHMPVQWVLPIGGEAELDSSAATLTVF
jgi:muramoyltetrapeptide carboxypeptidase